MLLAIYLQLTAGAAQRGSAVIHGRHPHRKLLRSHRVHLHIQRGLERISPEYLTIGSGRFKEITAFYPDFIRASHIILARGQREAGPECAIITQGKLAGLQFRTIGTGENHLGRFFGWESAAAIRLAQTQHTAHIHRITGAVEGAIQHQHRGGFLCILIVFTIR